MWTKEKSIGNFKNAMNALIESKYILADQKVGDVLKAIASSRLLYELFEHVTKDFDYATFKSVCFLNGEDGRGKFSMPKKDEDVLAFVFLLLMEIDSRREDILRLLLGYFYTGDSKQLSYNSFAMQVLIPFELLTERTAYKMINPQFDEETLAANNAEGERSRAAEAEKGKEADRLRAEEKPAAAGKRKGLEKLEYVLSRNEEKIAKAKAKEGIREELSFVKGAMLKYFAAYDDEGVACAFIAYRCLVEKVKKANVELEEVTEILGGGHGKED